MNIEINTEHEIWVSGIEPDNATEKNYQWSIVPVDVDETYGGIDSCVNTRLEENVLFLTFLVPGTYNIKCSATDGSGVESICNVDVRPMYALDISLSDNEITVEDNTGFELQAICHYSSDLNTLSLGENVIWSCSDNSVVNIDSIVNIVSNGCRLSRICLNALSAGTAVITCSSFYTSEKDSCVVTVESVLVDSITLSKSYATLPVGYSVNVTHNVYPLNASDASVTWTSSNSSVASVNNGLITALSVGSAVITCAANDGSGVTETFLMTVCGDYVDLGLTSGTLWATKNVGASAPEGYGDYISWGETSGYNSGKTYYGWSSYKYSTGSYNTLTKYNSNSAYGTVDNKTELDVDDDASYVNMGSSYITPSVDQWTELRTECTWEWTTLNGVNGYEVTGPNHVSIFLPAAGNRYNDTSANEGSGGRYWARTIYTEGLPCYAYNLKFESNQIKSNYSSRYYGYSFRPVCR